LIYALLQWVVILRYRSLIPLMWLVQLFETLGRMLVGRIKPVTFAHTPPGAYQNYIYLVLAVLMLVYLYGVLIGRQNTKNKPEKLFRKDHK